MLSILIPTYNYNSFPLVESLWQQAKLANVTFEIIVLDDGSTQFLNENELINNFEYCLFFKNENNLGRTQTRNILVKEAKYDWLLFLDADVMPVNLDFIKNYYSQIEKQFDAILGGIKYVDNAPDFSTILRYKYGKLREEILSSKRNKKPFTSILSANLLIKKAVFLTCNYTGEKNYYGMDNFFAYQLYANNYKVLHIDNPVYHLGLETNDVFFQKSLKSVEIRRYLLADFPQIENLNPILKKYKMVNQFGLKKIVAFVFRKIESPLRKRILNKNPNLFYFDLYRLGFMCILK